jgi:phosphate transport system permease protein
MAESPRKRQRRYRTHWTVKAADRAATGWITVGGIGTIIAVLGVCVFLVSVVVPLFLPGSAKPEPTAGVPWSGRGLIHLGLDEYQTMGYAVFRDGSIEAFRLDTGESLSTHQITDGRRITAWSFANEGDRLVLGFDDGTFELGSIGFNVDFPEADSLGIAAEGVTGNKVVTVEDGIVQRTPEGQLRRERLAVEFGDPIQAEATGAIAKIDFIERSDNPMVVVITSTGDFRANSVRQYENIMTGEVVSQVTAVDLPTPDNDPAHHIREGALPQYLTVNAAGTNIYVVWPDGMVHRYDARELDNATIAERIPLLHGTSAHLTAFRPLLGRTTLLAGDSRGRVLACFPYNATDSRTPDGVELARAHELDGPAAVTAIAPSPRSRMVAVGYEDGTIRAFQVTDNSVIFELHTGSKEPIEWLAVAPKNDGLIALSKSGLRHWRIDLRYPEVSLAALFMPVWYEGYAKPEHVWQSSGGTDDFEPKFGLWPLVFGTLKATFYSMLFGIPLALLAAIFSSEFLPPALRIRIKTLIEFMASLPSVVLGFLAALVFAPFVQKVVPTVMVGFVTMPGTFLLAAYIWQLLPHEWVLRLERYRMLFLLAILPVGMLLAVVLGPAVERLLFLGDLRLWLDGNLGSPFGGWVMLLLPLAAIVTTVILSRVAGPWLRARSAVLSARQMAVLDLARFAVGIGITIAVAAIVAWLFGQLGLDPRGTHGFLGTYVQRNALIVGFVMGFAIIPIIYTIAEDALTSVPEHLRAASLGAGATPWQTATRIVIPAAMSGLFSAIMIGLGRAVGETMIVLMAAGNTPLLDMNIFNGFRTLSANIAVELPEAVRNSTHYRTLFFAALILFLMTFIINTIAEMVRLRFRQKTQQL